MSKVVVFGATGYAGGAITSELLSRGHEVVGVARDVSKIDPNEHLTTHAGSIHDTALVSEVTEGADAIVIAVPARPVDGTSLLDEVPALLTAASKAGARLGVVGGAGSLLVAPGGARVLDSGFPEEYRPEAESHARVLGALKDVQTEVDWFYVSPAGEFGSWNAGERTGTFRLGDDVLVTDESGRSNISGADYAIAFVNEIETPAHHKARFTLGY